jgi:hypothetical protein
MEGRMVRGDVAGSRLCFIGEPGGEIDQAAGDSIGAAS